MKILTNASNKEAESRSEQPSFEKERQHLRWEMSSLEMRWSARDRTIWRCPAQGPKWTGNVR